MNINNIWKSFSLGTELSIAGSFIFNGLKTFDTMENFSREDEVFEFLYNISVGIERLEKILVILIEHKNITDQEKFEKSLITHNHQELLNRILKKHKCNFDNLRNEFLDLLSNFYKTMRYDRFNLGSIQEHDKERISLVNFLNKHLESDIKYKGFFVSPNQTKYKVFIGKVVGKISEVLYNLIVHEASAQNIYTYELPYQSKASIIFLQKIYNFDKPDIVWKEILIYLMNIDCDSVILDIISEIEPLDFDPKLVNEYISIFKSELKRFKYVEEIRHHYSDIINMGERLKKLELMGGSNIYFDEEY